MFGRFNTRERAIFTTIFTGALLFFLISPLSKYVFETILPPSDVKNIEVVEKSKEIDLNWSKNSEYDLKGYVISVNGKKIDDKKLTTIDVDNYPIYDLVNGKEYAISIRSLDYSERVSNAIDFKVTPSDQISTTYLNLFNESSNSVKDIVVISAVIVIFLFLMNIWVLFFKLKRKTLLTIAAFPSMSLIPYLILSLSILFTINSTLNKFIFASAVTLLYFFVCYLLILTSNILNGSLSNSIPLEQAGKAAQFIFGLISTYLMLIFMVSTNYNLVYRLGVLLFFVFYFTYSSLSMIKGIGEYQILIKTITIVLVMGISIVVMSVWPIDSVYAILAIAVIYYILLNISLEIRNKLGKGLWVEYSVLLVLVTFLLLTNSIWGIRGSIF